MRKKWARKGIQNVLKIKCLYEEVSSIFFMSFVVIGIVNKLGHDYLKDLLYVFLLTILIISL